MPRLFQYLSHGVSVNCGFETELSFYYGDNLLACLQIKARLRLNQRSTRFYPERISFFPDMLARIVAVELSNILDSLSRTRAFS